MTEAGPEVEAGVPEIPLGRATALCLKWTVAALPSLGLLLVLYFLFATLISLASSSGASPGLRAVEVQPVQPAR